MVSSKKEIEGLYEKLDGLLLEEKKVVTYLQAAFDFSIPADAAKM